MPGEIPKQLTDPREQQLWIDLYLLYEEYCGDDEQEEWRARQRSFLAVLLLLSNRLYVDSELAKLRPSDRVPESAP